LIWRKPVGPDHPAGDWVFPQVVAEILDTEQGGATASPVVSTSGFLRRPMGNQTMNARDVMGAVAPGDGETAERARALLRQAGENGMHPWRLRGRELLPVVQGGMGVGVSAGGLAGAVASLGGVGTVS
jgi:hypothetical protein